MQFQMWKNKRKDRGDPRVHGSKEFHSNICIERIELEICVNHYCQVLANDAFRYGRDSVECDQFIFAMTLHALQLNAKYQKLAYRKPIWMVINNRLRNNLIGIVEENEDAKTD